MQQGHLLDLESSDHPRFPVAREIAEDRVLACGEDGRQRLRFTSRMITSTIWAARG